MTDPVEPAAEPVPLAAAPDATLPVVEMDPDAAAVAAVAVGAVVATGATVVVVVVVVVVGTVVSAQSVGAVMVFASRLTAPFRARTRPWTTAPVSSVADVSAMMVPTNVLPVLRVAELVTCQNTLHAEAPFSSATTLSVAVTRLEDAWNTNTEFGSPWPLSTSGLPAVMLAVVAAPKA